MSSGLGGGDTTVGDDVAPLDRDTLTPGTAIGRYVVLQQIGEGGMGVVYSAYDPELDRRVALKLLHRYAESGGAERSHRRLIREAQALARLSHPNVVAVHDAGTDRGRVFIAMEFVEGETLRQWYDRGGREVDTVLSVYREAGRGLAAAHAAGLVHRDFKPANVMLGQDGRVRVMDFGLANADPTASAKIAADEQVEDAPPDATLSRGIPGTPAYMAAEQLLRKPVGPAADQFAFCVCVWEAVFRQRPFAGPASGAGALAVIQGEIDEPPRTVRVPAGVRAALRRGLLPDPQARWPSMDALLECLDPTPRWRRWWPVASVAVTVGAVGALAAAGPDDACEGVDRPIWERWDDRQRERLAESFSRVGVPLAETTWSRVGPMLDERASQWSEARIRACRAPVEPELQSVQLDCLLQRKVEFVSWVSTLETVDAAGLSNVVPGTRQLGDVSRCSDPSFLRSAVPLPANVEVGRAVDDAREAVAAARAADNAGAQEGAVLQAATAAVERAAATGYRPVLAEAQLVLARASPPDASRRAPLLDAWYTAIGSEHDLVATEAAISLARASLLDDEQYDLWLRNAQSYIERLGPGPETLAHLLLIEARYYTLRRQRDTAQAKLDEALELLDGLGSPREIDLRIQGAQLSRGYAEYEEALRNLASARELVLKSYGEDHPTVITLDRIQGEILFAMGRHEDAMRVLDVAAKRAEAAYGANHTETARAISTVGAALAAAGKYEEALPYQERSVRIFEDAEGYEDALRIALTNLGVNLDYLERYEESADKHQRALELLQAGPPPAPIAIPIAYDNLGSALQGLGDYERAIELHREAAELWEELLGPEHPSLAISLRDYGRARLGHGQAAAAVPLFERSLRIFAASEVDPLEQATTRIFLARALEATGSRGERMNALRAEARQQFAAAGDAGQRRWDQLQRWGVEPSASPLGAERP